MTLPVSNYQELLIQVRELTHETIRLQRQLSSDLFDNADPPDVNHNFSLGQKNYERGKRLTDNVVRQCDNSRKNEAGQNHPLAEYNNFRFRPRFCQNLDTSEGIHAGELTSRLLTWRSRNHRSIILQEDTVASHHKRPDRLSTEECRVPHGSASVGAEGVGSWRAQRRPHGVEAPTPLAGVAAHELESSVDGATFNPVVVAAAATSARCSAARNALITAASSHCSSANAVTTRPRLYLGPATAETTKEDAMEPEVKEEDERRSSTPSPEGYARRSKRYNEGGSSEEENRPDTSLQGHRLPSSYRGTWPIRRDLWANQQMGFSAQQSSSTTVHNDVASVMSFSSNSGGTLGCSSEMQGDRRLGAKVDVVYNLLGMLGSTEGREDMSATLLSMSTSIDNCLIMRQSGCLPLLVQLIHAPGQDPETRERASRALHNIVHAKSDERAGRREARVLRFLEQLRDYCQALRTSLETGQVPEDLERHPGQTIAALMKLSFDEAHRHAMCQLGGLHAVAELIEMDHTAHGSECDDQNCITLRRYAGMALTNLTFGDGNNKALLCSFREFMKALVSQLRSPSDDLRQVTASVLRNLSWRADTSSKQTLREVGAVTGLMKAAMEGRKESTLKSILSALWNLSAHCSTNKVDICAVEGALAFLVDTLSYKAPSKTLAIVENAGGILRNVSSHIAVREDYRAIVRERGCLQVLLQQLRSPSLTVVSNACGALWNLSARCPQDQRLLWDLGAVPMLRSLIHSKHKMISMGSSAALKNLLSARPGCNNLIHLDSTARGLGLPTLPTLVARRQRALEQEIDQNLAETCDNIEPSTSPTNKDDKFSFKVDHSFLGMNARTLRPYQLHNQPSTSSMKCNGVARSESRDSMRSITSTHSDTMFERVNRHVQNGLSPTDVQMKQQSSSLHSAVGFDTGMSSDSHTKTSSEKKYTLRYKNAIPDRLKSSDTFNGVGDLRCTNSTISWSSAPDQESACSQNLLHSSVEDNLPQSMSSASKAGSQSSVSEETELNVCAKTEYQCVVTKTGVDTPSSLSFTSSSSPVKDTVGFGTMYDKSVLHQHNPLNSIQKAISPTVAHRTEGNLFSDYAETDLDQPTDYSLRYAERSLEDEEKQHSHYFVSNEQGLVHEDTVKTYCTEGTPHGTSLNSSRAASASDLQEDSRQRNLSRKMQEQGKLQTKEALNLACTVKALDEKKRNQVLNYFEANIKTESVEENGHPSVKTPLSFRTTLNQISPNNLHYEESDNTASNSDKIRSDPEKKYETQNNIPVNAVNSYVISALKASSDSGYQVSDGDEDDEDLLTACINIGMQNNRHRHSFIGNNFEKLPRNESNLARYQTSVALDQMECNIIVDSAMNNLDKTQIACEEAMSSDARKSKVTESLPNIASDYSQYTAKLPQKVAETRVAVGRSDKVIESELGIANRNSGHSLLIVDDNLCNFSLPSNLRNSPILHETVVFNTEPNQQQYLSSMDTQSNEDMSSFVHNDLLEDEGNEDGKALEGSKDKSPEDLSMQQSYTKVTDSESSESIDSVEQSEHALLELCIQPGLTKTIEHINLNKAALKSNKALNVFKSTDINYSSDGSSMYNDTCEVDGVKRDETDEKRKSLQRAGGGTPKHGKKEEVYRRQRDPDAMIASLDRLTVTLVQQTEAIRERDSSAMKHSILSDAWNEDSPNEISFPSISISAPIIASFKSDVQEDQCTATSEYVETASSESAHMTNSKIIQREAFRLAEAVDAEINKHQEELETTSMSSMDLEAIKPPSSMGSLLSLTASYAGSGDCSEVFINRDRCNSTSLPPVQVKTVSSTDSRSCRKKSLPLGVVAKRALSQTQSHAGSLENLLNECTGSHLDSVKPPSMMDELFDVGDMENSMVSVASITSEVADPKDQESHSLTNSDAVFDLLKPVANILSITCMRYAEAMQSSGNNSLSECLENINPPSLFNEVCEMDESTMEQATDTICSDTLCIDAELQTEEAPHPIVVEKIDEGGNDTDEAVTPISSEYCGTSSAESTPKKRLQRNLTPKQKRTLAKERYKTYTIAAEMDKKREDRGETGNGEVEKIRRGKCSPFSKLTPKQRRQEDRARFQTQVLENPFPEASQDQRGAVTSGSHESPEKPEAASPVKSAIPTFTKFSACKTLIKNRMEQKKNRERYRTRTLNDSECIFRDAEGNAAANATGASLAPTVPSDDIQTMLEQNATIVLNTLNESNKVNENGEEMLLDYETISLVSNESESERTLRMRFVNGVSKKLMGACSQQMGEEQAPGDSRKETAEIEPVRSQEDIRFADTVESESDDESNNAEEPPRETKRPRIIKPGMVRDPSNDSNATDKSEPESPKAIRGRRKALYSNPITRKPTPQSSPLKQVNPVSGIPIGRSNTSPIVRATRATTLRQNNNSPNNMAKEPPKSAASFRMTPISADGEKRGKNLSAAAKRASVPQKGSSLTFTKSVKRHSTPPTCSSSAFQPDGKSDVTVKPLERQGTFTKDEPEVENAPLVLSSASSPVKTKIAKPIKGATSKVHPATGKPKIPPKAHQAYQSKVPKGNASEKILPPKPLPLLVAPKRLPTGKATPASKAQASNQNAQAENGKVFRKVGPLGQRSNSNSSIVSNSSTGLQTRKLAKEATSKIASLWKKVEESKNRQRFEKPDTRQWVQPAANVVDAPSPASNPPTFRLFRSSTFEGVPQENDSPGSTLYKSKSKKPLAAGVQSGKMKYRNSCDLSGMNASDAPCKIPVKSGDASAHKKDVAQVGDASVILRKQQNSESSAMEVDPTKRISRLGSFIRVDSAHAEGSAQTYANVGGVRALASAIVPPFNYNPKVDVPSQTARVTADESESKFGAADCHADIVTASTRVTTV